MGKDMTNLVTDLDISTNFRFTPKETLLKLLQHEIHFGIMLSLSYYKSLKLKQIATFISKTAPTTLHHIKQLATNGVIEIDPTKIVGKYYRLAKFGNKLFDILKSIDQPQDGESLEEEIILEKAKTYDDIKLQANIMRTFGIISKNISYHAADYIEVKCRDKDFFKEDKEEKMNLRIYMEDVKIKNRSQQEAYENVLKSFIKRVEKIKNIDSSTKEEEFEEIDFTLHLVSIPMSIMHPDKIDELRRIYK